MNISRRVRGFTLLELLVAIALLALLSVAVYTFMWHLLDRERRAMVMSGRTQTATVLFERLERDLLTAVAAAPNGAGLRGDEHMLTIFHRSVLAGGPNAPIADLQRTTVRFEPLRHRLFLEREDAAQGQSGPGTTSPGFGFDTDESEPAEPEGLLASDIRAVRFRYHDGRSWHSSFSSTRGLPVAVEVALWFSRGEPGQDVDEQTSVDSPEGPAFDDAGAAGVDVDPAQFDPTSVEAAPTTRPDRLRVIVIPDTRDQPTDGGEGGTP